MIWLLLLLVNPSLTPGAIRPLSQSQICATKWSLDVRHVSKSKRANVYLHYHIPLSERKHYIIDHLIPRELGGADVEANLWPQTHLAAKVKDRIENTLHRDVCRSVLTLESAQLQMRQWNHE